MQTLPSLTTEKCEENRTETLPTLLTVSHASWSSSPAASTSSLGSSSLGALAENYSSGSVCVCNLQIVLSRNPRWARLLDKLCLMELRWGPGERPCQFQLARAGVPGDCIPRVTLPVPCDNFPVITALRATKSPAGRTITRHCFPLALEFTRTEHYQRIFHHSLDKSHWVGEGRWYIALTERKFSPD